MRLKSVFYTGSIFIGVLLFIFTIFKIGIKMIIATLAMVSLGQFWLLVAINLMGVALSIVRWRMIFRAFGTEISLLNITMAKFIGIAMNYLTPGGLIFGGVPFRVLFLKSEANIPYKTSLISIIVDEILFLSITFLVIIIGLFYLFEHADLSRNMMIAIISSLALLTVIFYVFYRRTVYRGKGEDGFFSYIINVLHLNRFQWVANMKNKIIETENTLCTFFKVNNKTILISTILLTVVESVLYLAMYWFTILYLGHRISFQMVMSIISLTYVNYLLPIPGALGTFELSQAYLFGVFGMGENVGLGFSLLTRIVTLVFVAVGLAILGFFEIKILWEKLSQRIIYYAKKISDLYKK